MKHSKERLASWIAEFADEYVHIALTGDITGDNIKDCGFNPIAWAGNNSQGQPLYAFPIDRLLLDSEFGMEASSLLTIRGAARDSAKWDSWEVPGSGGKTMAQLWAEAAAVWDVPPSETYGWRADPTQMGSPNFDWFAPANRRVVYWYNTIAVRAKQAVLREAIYAPATDKLSQLGVVPKCGNYGDFSADGLPDTSGWMNIRGPRSLPQNGPDYDLLNYTVVPSKSVPRFVWRGQDQTSRLLDYGSLGRWYTYASIPAEANVIDMPHLYQVNTTNFYNHLQQMQNLYLPSHPAEDAFDAQMRNNRHRVESAINSFGGARQESVEPYWPFPNGNNDGVFFTRSMSRDLLAMMRAKDVRQVYPFRGGSSPSSTPDGAAWTQAMQVYEQVYAFKIMSAAWFAGDNATYSVHPLGDLTNTLRAPANHPLGLDTVAAANSVDSDQVGAAMTEFVVKFEPWEASAVGNGIQINFECSIDIPGLSSVPARDMESVYGEVYIWNPSNSSTVGGKWQPIVMGDDPNSPTRYGFGTDDLSTRRTIRISDASGVISNQGEIQLLFRHTVTGTETGSLPDGHFFSKYNLVQVLRIDGTSGGSLVAEDGPFNELPATVAGPDVNFSGEVNATDLLNFSESLSNGQAAADYDGDGTVTTDDVAGFLTDFTSSTTP